LRLRLNSGGISVLLGGRLGCAGEETSLDLIGLTLRSEQMPQTIREFQIARETGPAIRLGQIDPPQPPRIELTLDEDDLSCP